MTATHGPTEPKSELTGTAYTMVNGTACNRCGKLFYYIGDVPAVCSTCETANLENQVSRLEREKQLLHERIEELELRLQMAENTDEDCYWISRREHESLKADALELKRLKDTDFAEFQKRIPVEWFIDITDLLGLPNTASLDQILEAVRDACGITREPLSQIKADAEKWRQYQKGLAGGLPQFP